MWRDGPARARTRKEQLPVRSTSLAPRRLPVGAARPL
jgi:hypothetical protein